MTKEWALFQTPMTRSRSERDKCTFLTDILFAHSFLVYGTVVLPVTTPPYHALLHSLFFWGGGRGGGALESTMLAYHFQENRTYLPPTFYPSFILVIFTSRIYVTLNLPINSSASRNGLEHKKILLYCTDSNRLSVFTGWF